MFVSLEQRKLTIVLFYPEVKAYQWIFLAEGICCDIVKTLIASLCKSHL